MQKICVAIYNAKGMLANSFETLHDAATFLNVPLPNIYRALSKGSQHIKVSNFYVRSYDDVKMENGELVEMIELDQKTKTITQYDLAGNLVTRFDDIDHAHAYFSEICADSNFAEKFSRSKLQIHANKGSLICVSPSNTFFLAKGNKPKLNVVRDEVALPIRTYFLIKNGAIIDSTYDVGEIATRLGISKKLVHSTAQTYRKIASEYKVTYVESTSLTIQH